MDAPYSVKAQMFFASEQGKEYFSGKVVRADKAIPLRDGTNVRLATPDEMDAHYRNEKNITSEIKDLKARLEVLLLK